MRRLIVYSLVLTLFALGCKKDKPITPDRGRTYLHILDAVPADTFNLTFDYFSGDDVVIKNFFFRRNFPMVGYADMEAGGTPDAHGNGKLYLTGSMQPFVNVGPDTLMWPRDIILDRDMRSTICLVDSFGTVTLVKMKDEFSFATDTSVAVRFINLSFGVPVATLRSTDGAIGIPNVAFMGNSQFVAYPHGQYDVEIQDGSGSVIASMSLWLNGRTAYSFYIVGNTIDFFLN